METKTKNETNEETCRTVTESENVAFETVRDVADEAELYRALSGETVCAVLFYAGWCSGCKMQAAEFYGVATDLCDRITFLKADVDLTPAAAKDYGIDEIPSVAVIKSGKLFEKVSGLRSKAGLCELLIKYI